MLVDSLIEQLPQSFSNGAPEAAVAVWCQCAVGRNFGDFPFPQRCTESEKRTIEKRTANMFDQLSLLATGTYYSLSKLEPIEARFLAERQFITRTLLQASGPRGAYVADDQGLSIMVNGLDHLCVRAVLSGNQLQEAWARVNLMDDTLNGAMDFAFDARLGFLTSELGNVGTGLKASVLLHLPASMMTNRMGDLAAMASERQLALKGIRTGLDLPVPPERKTLDMQAEFPPPGIPAQASRARQALYSEMEGAVCGPFAETTGGLYLLVNQSTLGVSEEEIVFQVRRTASEIVAEEESAREVLRRMSPRDLPDRAGRARGLAGGAHILGFEESLDLLSELRLGVSSGDIEGHEIQELNELLIRSQGAHLELGKGLPCDDLTLNGERADLFRSHFPL